MLQYYDIVVVSYVSFLAWLSLTFALFTTRRDQLGVIVVNEFDEKTMTLSYTIVYYIIISMVITKSYSSVTVQITMTMTMSLSLCHAP